MHENDQILNFKTIFKKIKNSNFTHYIDLILIDVKYSFFLAYTFSLQFHSVIFRSAIAQYRGISLKRAVTYLM